MAVTALIVDDSTFMRATLASSLKEAGVDIIIEAEDGRQAHEMYKRLRPSFVTMDITMPDMDGIDALKLIREFDPYAKVIMLSSLGQHDFVIRAFKAGASDFIVKPVKVDRLVEAVKKVLKKR